MNKKSVKDNTGVGSLSDTLLPLNDSELEDLVGGGAGGAGGLITTLTLDCNYLPLSGLHRALLLASRG